VSAAPLYGTAAGVAGASGAVTIQPAGGWSPGLYNVWNATAALSRPGASVVALVDGQPVASAYGLTATLGPVQSAGNSQVQFQIQGDTPGAPVSVVITGYQADNPGDLPQLGGTSNATIVNINPMDGAELVNLGNGGVQNFPTNYVSTLMDVSQWESLLLAVNPQSSAAGGLGITAHWFDPSGLVQLGGWGAEIAAPTTGAYDGAQSPFGQLLLPNRGPQVIVGMNNLDSPGTPFSAGLQLFQSNRTAPGAIYSLAGPYLARYVSFTLASGNSQFIPCTGLYCGPAFVHWVVPAGPTIVNLQARMPGGYITVWTNNGVAASGQATVTIPPAQCQFIVTNNSGASQTYSLEAWVPASGSN
jgi:hypothetical protein